MEMKSKVAFKLVRSIVCPSCGKSKRHHLRLYGDELDEFLRDWLIDQINECAEREVSRLGEASSALNELSRLANAVEAGVVFSAAYTAKVHRRAKEVAENKGPSFLSFLTQKLKDLS